MKSFKELLYKLNVTDLIVVVFYVFLTLMNLAFCCRITQWPVLIVMNMGVIAAVFGIAWLDHPGQNKLWNSLHYWYLVPLILLTFKELYLMIMPIRMHDYDYLLIAADRFMFGTDPTHILYKISNPLLTEILQIAYASFYFLPIILGVDLMLKHKLTKLEFGGFSIVYGFFLSYLGYFLLPAIGPRFTLHNFFNTGNELPGLLLTNFLREVVNTGESIPTGTLNPAEIVQRDVFPSGHTQMTLITMYLAYKYKTSSRYFIIPVGSLLIFATVYLRYHYVVDLIGGSLFMIFTMWSGVKLFNWWQGVKNLPKFDYSNPD